MINLDTVSEIIDHLQTVVIQDKNSIQNLITIEWDEGFVIIERNSKQSVISIEKEFFESKDDFLRELINSIKKFSLQHIYASIKVCDSLLPDDCPLCEIKSCDTFHAKVAEYTGLKKLVIFELLLPIYQAQIYFFVRPENLDESLAKLIVTPESFHTALVNSLYVEMLNASEQLANVSFLGKINNSDHEILKRIVESVVRNLLNHLKKQKYSESSIEDFSTGVIDLTAGLIEDVHDKTDDETFYDFTTSDIIEIDFPLSHFYDKEIKGLKDGWDATIDVEKYHESISYDEELMFRFLDTSLNDDNFKSPLDEEDQVSTKKPTVDKKPIKRSKSDDDLQIVSITSTSDSLGKNSGKWTFRQRNNGKVRFPQSKKVNLPSTRISLGGNVASKKIKSRIFNDEEVVKWERAKGHEDMTNLMLSTSKDFKNLSTCLEKGYKIPRKSYNGPSPRPSIHNSKDFKKQEAEPRLLEMFQRRVESIAPYDSPSGHRLTERSTPESVSKFIDVETIHVIDDDEDDNNNNNHSNNNKASQKGPAKRKLLNISPQTQIFKSRRTDYSSYDSLFSSKDNRNSFRRRKL